MSVGADGSASQLVKAMEDINRIRQNRTISSIWATTVVVPPPPLSLYLSCHSLLSLHPSPVFSIWFNYINNSLPFLFTLCTCVSFLVDVLPIISVQDLYLGHVTLLNSRSRVIICFNSIVDRKLFFFLHEKL